MALYNTMVSVIANLEAGSESAAVAMLARTLEAHGFTVMTEPGEPVSYAGAFAAGDGTQRDYLRSGCAPYPGRHWFDGSPS